MQEGRMNCQNCSYRTDHLSSPLQVLKSVNVNLVDLINRRETGEPRILPKFPNRQALRKYTLGNGKVFPKRAAKQDGFIKVLLREIF